MTVDFVLKRAPAYRVAAIRWNGQWSDAAIHRQFDRVVAWARAHHLRTGRWIFREPDEQTFEVAIEIRGSARSEAPVRVKTYRAGSVASVVYDPAVVASPVVYHGLSDWLRSRRRDGTITAVGDYREIYRGDPWRDRAAFARTEVQFMVKRPNSGP